jgi:hypothetical protein
MNLYQLLTTYSIYGIIWSGYSLCILLSARDGMFFKIILFIILFYFTYSIGLYLNKSKKFALVTSILGAAIYMFAKLLFTLLTVN